MIGAYPLQPDDGGEYGVGVDSSGGRGRLGGVDMHGATQGIEMSGAKKKLFSSSPGTPAPSSGRKSVVTTPATPCLPPGEFIVAAAPVKATTGGSGTALALAACVVQLSPADMEASSIPLDAFVVIESMEGSLLGVGRVWPHRPLKPGTVRLGWHVYNTHQSVFESSTVHIRLSVLTLPEGAKIAPVASSITCTPYADVSDVLAALSLSFSEANSVIDDSLRPVMPLEDVAMHTVRKLLRGTLCLVGMTVSVRLRGEPRTLKITNATVESRTAVGIGGTGPPTLFSVDSSTNITVTFTPGPASSPDASAPVPSAETTAMSTPLSFGGMDKQAEAIRTMLRLPLQQPELFARMGLQPYRGILLYGPPGGGKTHLARALTGEMGVPVFTIRGPEVFTAYVGASESMLKGVFASAGAVAPAIVLIDEIDAMCPKRSDASEVEGRVVATLLTLMDGIRGSEAIVVLATTSRVGTLDPALRRAGRFDREIEIGVPTVDDRRSILLCHLSRLPHSLTPEDVTHAAAVTHGYVPSDIVGLCKEAAMAALRRRSAGGPPPCISSDDIAIALSKTSPSALREVAVDVPKVLWSDIGGQDSCKQALKEAVEWPLKHPEAFKRMGIRPPKGVLLYGPPGCSKTLLAKALATEGGMNFIAVKGPEFLSKWVGESEKAIQEVFRKARAASPCVVFFDEIDAVAVSRGGSGGGDVMTRVVSQLLHELDGVTELKRVVVVAATNRPDILDPAFLRPGRIDRLLYVGPPDEKSRAQIITQQLRRIPHSAECDDPDKLSALVSASSGFSGAECVSFTREAALAALTEDIRVEEVQWRHLSAAASRVKPQITAEMIKFYSDFQTRAGHGGRK